MDLYSVSRGFISIKTIHIYKGLHLGLPYTKSGQSPGKTYIMPDKLS